MGKPTACKPDGLPPRCPMKAQPFTTPNEPKGNRLGEGPRPWILCRTFDDSAEGCRSYAHRREPRGGRRSTSTAPAVAPQISRSATDPTRAAVSPPWPSWPRGAARPSSAAASKPARLPTAMAPMPEFPPSGWEPNLPLTKAVVREDSDDEDPEEGSSPGGAMPQPRATQEEPSLELIHQLAEHGLERVGAQGPVVSMGVPRSQLPRLGRHPDPHGPAGAAPPGRSRPGGHGAGDRSPSQAPAAAGDSPAGVGHELRGPLRGGQAGPGHGRGACRHGHLLRRRGDAERRAGRQPPLPLRTRAGDVRLSRRPPGPGAGLSLQGRPGSQDRHRGASTWRESHRQHRQGARHPRRRTLLFSGALRGPVHPGRFPPLRRSGAGTQRRYSGGLQAERPAHRGRISISPSRPGPTI